MAKDETLNEKEQNDSRMKHGRKERKNESHNGKMKLRDRRALPEVAAGVSLVISVSVADEEEDFDDSVEQDLPDLIDISDEENDDEHDENEMNELEDIEEVSYFLNPFGTRIYSFVSSIANVHGIYSFALRHENLQRGTSHSH